MRGLDYHTATVVATASTASHLHHKLKGALRGPEVGGGEEVVGIEDSDGADPSEVEALGDYLCTNKDVGLVVLEAVNDAFKGTLGGRGVAI